MASQIEHGLEYGYQQVREKGVPHGKASMADWFGYMVLWRCGQSWGIEYGPLGYGEASRRAWEMTLYGECDFAKAMNWNTKSYPYNVHREMRFGDNPVTIFELALFLERKGLGLYTTVEVRRQEMFMMREDRKDTLIDIKSDGFW